MKAYKVTYIYMNMYGTVGGTEDKYFLKREDAEAVADKPLNTKTLTETGKVEEIEIKE